MTRLYLLSLLLLAGCKHQEKPLPEPTKPMPWNASACPRERVCELEWNGKVEILDGPNDCRINTRAELVGNCAHILSNLGVKVRPGRTRLWPESLIPAPAPKSKRKPSSYTLEDFGPIGDGTVQDNPFLTLFPICKTAEDTECIEGAPQSDKCLASSALGKGRWKQVGCEQDKPQTLKEGVDQEDFLTDDYWPQFDYHSHPPLTSKETMDQCDDIIWEIIKHPGLSVSLKCHAVHLKQPSSPEQGGQQ